MNGQNLHQPSTRLAEYLLRLRRTRLDQLRAEADRLEALAGIWARLGALDRAAERYTAYRRIAREAEALATDLDQEEQR